MPGAGLAATLTELTPQNEVCPSEVCHSEVGPSKTCTAQVGCLYKT
jgi:hypothetical protein